MKNLLIAKALGAAAFIALSAQASMADPVCTAGFQTVQKTSGLLKCKRTVPMAQKGVALTQAQTAQCKTNSYWNYGPAITAKHSPANLRVTVRYTCGHVEG